MLVSRKPARLFLLVIFVLLSNVNFDLMAQVKTLTSNNNKAVMLELYTSQGCSSCPPAEYWISKLSDDERLWKTLFPLNFHVDYWDYLGWKDPFASPLFSQRQRRYEHLGHSTNVATPGFVVNGKGWNGWFSGQRLIAKNLLTEQSLAAQITKEKIDISFNSATQKELEVHVAILGFGIKTHIKRGENQGKQLNHDFVVVGYAKNTMQKSVDQLITQLPMPSIKDVPMQRKSIVIWVSTKTDLQPLQVIGDWL